MSSNCPTREVYTVRVDSEYVTSPSTDASFTAFLNIPLQNVVRAELLSASIHPTSNSVSKAEVYVHVEELISKFVTRAAPIYQQATAGLTSNTSSITQIVSNSGKLSEAFAALPVDLTLVDKSRVLYTSSNSFPTVTDYINPIRRLDRLTINLYNAQGTLLTTIGTSYFIFRFECAKDNSCLY